MDCMEGMGQFPNNYFDLAIVDPPYGININMNMGRKKGQPKKHDDKKWDGSTPDIKYFDELRRVSKHQIIWGGNYFNLPSVRGWIFWDKNVPNGVSFSDGELAWTNFDRVLKKIDVPYSGFIGSEGKIHPTQKPVLLYRWILKEYGQAVWKILDTHVGSGSSLIACEREGFDYVGFEIDPDYYKSAKERIERERQQLTLALQ